MLKALMYEMQYKDYSPDFAMYEGLLDKDIPVIEFGSGTGRISYHLLQKGYTVFGIEKDADFRSYFVQKLQTTYFPSKFKYIDDVREVKFPCNIIYPFNVLFYLDEKTLCTELNKLQHHPFHSVVFETDNIITLSSENLSTKRYEFKDFLFKEQSFLEKSRILIRSEVLRGEELILKFEHSLYLHKAELLLGMYEKHFKTIKLYGDFTLSNYNDHSNKLIALIKS